MGFKDTHFISIQLYFMLHLHWPSLNAINHTTSYRQLTNQLTKQLRQVAFLVPLTVG